MNVARASTGRMGLLAVDQVAMGYFVVTGAMAAIFGGSPGLWIAAGHGLVVLGIGKLAGWQPRSGLMGFVRASYGVLITPPLYAELATLNRFFTERFFDDTVQGWEAGLFGGQPSMDLSALLPWLPLSEALHLGYFAYYAIVPAAMVGVYLTRGFEALHRTALAIAIAFFTSYLIFILFPVAGPRYFFERIQGPISEGTMYGLVHAILESGSSKGTAFPSSHIAASLAAILGAGREDARWLWLLIVPEIALALGTIYGRFHYAIDAVAGVALALAAVGVAARLGSANELSASPGTGSALAEPSGPPEPSAPADPSGARDPGNP